MCAFLLQWCTGVSPSDSNNNVDYSPFYTNSACMDLYTAHMTVLLNRVNTGTSPFIFGASGMHQQDRSGRHRKDRGLLRPKHALPCTSADRTMLIYTQHDADAVFEIVCTHLEKEMAV